MCGLSGSAIATLLEHFEAVHLSALSLPYSCACGFSSDQKSFLFEHYKTVHVSFT